MAQRDNPYADEQLEKFKEQLQWEHKIVPHKQDLISELGMKADKKGHFIDHPCGIRFRYVPPGRFLMGDVVAKPVHPVLISRGFFLSETEISQEQWMKIFDVNPSKNQSSPKLPLTNLNWSEALIFCNALNDEYGYQTISEEEDPSRIHHHEPSRVPPPHRSGVGIRLPSRPTQRPLFLVARRTFPCEKVHLTHVVRGKYRHQF